MSVYLFSKIHVELMRGGEQPTEKEKKKKRFFNFRIFSFFGNFRISHFAFYFIFSRRQETGKRT